MGTSPDNGDADHSRHPNLEVMARQLMEHIQDLPVPDARVRLQLMIDKYHRLLEHLLNEPLFISWIEKHAGEILGTRKGD